MSCDEGEEKDWVLRSKAGDLGAFEQLIRIHQRMVRNITYRYTGNRSDADDLAQDSFIRAWQKIDHHRDTASFGGWLRRITINTCLQWNRGRRTTQPVEEFHLQAQIETVGEGYDDTSSIV